LGETVVQDGEVPAAWDVVRAVDGRCRVEVERFAELVEEPGWCVSFVGGVGADGYRFEE
jgi:hypothetical protein